MLMRFVVVLCRFYIHLYHENLFEARLCDNITNKLHFDDAYLACKMLLHCKKYQPYKRTFNSLYLRVKFVFK